MTAAIGAGWPRFTIRAALGATLLAALACGWYSSLQRQSTKVSQLAAELAYAQAELARSLSSAPSPKWTLAGNASHSDRVLWLAKLDGTNLRATQIQSGDSAFQFTLFADCDLRGATLVGEAAAFQGARFDRAKLAKATLTGGNAAFQHASFAHADLSGAVLTGGASAFQGASLEGAKLVGAQVKCSGPSFQGVNIDGTQFQGADLSSLDRDSLASCFFKTPPRYDEKTRFPAGFDPAAHDWARAAK